MRRRTKPRVHALEALLTRLALATSELLSPGWSHAANDQTTLQGVSDDARYTLFTTAATNLDPMDTDTTEDLYRYDRITENLSRIPTKDKGLGAQFVRMSADGNSLLFALQRTEIIFGEPVTRTSLLHYDIPSGQVLPVTPATMEYDTIDVKDEISYDMTDDGGSVVFTTKARNIVAGDTNRKADVFLWRKDDRSHQMLTAPVLPDTLPNGDSSGVSISGDGRYVLFQSESTNLVNADYLASTNLFRLDRTDHSTLLISKQPGTNTSLNASSYAITLSDSGKSVFFRTTASNTGVSEATDRYIWQADLDSLRNVNPSATNLVFNATDTRAAYSYSGQHIEFLNIQTMEITYPTWFGSLIDTLGSWSLTRDFRYLKYDIYPWMSGGVRAEVVNQENGQRTTSYEGGTLAKDAPIAVSNGYQRPRDLKESVPEVAIYEHGIRTLRRQVYIQDIETNTSKLASIDKTPDPWPVDTKRPQVSNDGRYVLYERVTPTLAVPDQTVPGPVLYDRTTGTMRLLGLPGVPDLMSPGGRYLVYRTGPADGVQTPWMYDIMNGDSIPLVVDASNRPKAFYSGTLCFSDDDSSFFFNAPVRDVNPAYSGDAWAVYRFSTQDRTVQLVSAVVGGTTPGSRGATSAQSSRDGRYLVFATTAADMYPDDRNDASDVFLWDLAKGQTTLVSQNAFTARTGNAASTNPRISLDGTRVVFESSATNLVAADTNGRMDVFSFTPATQQMSLVSIRPDGTQANGDSRAPTLTEDGQRVAFLSSATNLTDTTLAATERIHFRDFPAPTLRVLAGYTMVTEATLSRTGRWVTLRGDRGKVITEIDPAKEPRKFTFPLPFDPPYLNRGSYAQIVMSGDESTLVYTQYIDTRIPNAYPPNADLDRPVYHYAYAFSLKDEDSAQKAFAPPTTFDSGPESNDVDLADLNGDGHLDAFFTNYTTLGHRIFFGDGQGGFVDSGQRLTGAPSFYSALGDLDGDGDIDAYIPTLGPDTIWFNDGRGNFTDSGLRIGNDRSIDVALGDLDGDGDLDAYVANFEAKPDRVWLNRGNGTFVDSGQELGDTWSKGIELGDVDGDGDLDALVANGTNRGGEPNRVWLNDGRARFTDSGQRLGNSQTQHGALGDADGDGDLDAVFANSTNLAEPNELWLNDGKGVFTDSGQQLGNESTSHVAFADFDGDKDLDLFFANWLNQPSDVWFNDGRGNYTRGADRLGMSQGSHVAIGDLNGDGQLDALLANTDNKAELYLNRGEPWDADANPNRVVEMAALRTPVGITIAAKPPTEPGSTRFSLVDDAGGRFAIDTNTGVVTVKNGSLLDAQQSTRHTILAHADVPGRGSFLRSFSISVVSPYQPLQARADGYSTQDGVELVIPSSTGLLANDTVDPSAVASVKSHDPLTMLGVPVAVEASGAFRYDTRQQAVLQALPQGATLEDRFQYTASTNRPESSSATVTITVVGVNDGPIANPDSLSLLEGLRATDITATLLENDTDPDTNGKAALRVQAFQPQGLRGKLELRGDRLWYEAGQAFNYLMVGQTAEERFQYTIADEHGATSSTSVVIVIRGESNRPSDINGDDLVDIADLEELCRGIRTLPVDWRFDVNRDRSINEWDLDYYLAITLRTTHGDANLDSAFDSADLVLAFQSGQYEDAVAGNSRWSTGDWNCDGEFNSSDLVRAFQSGAYTQNAVIHVRPWPAAECNATDRVCSIQTAVNAASPGDTILAWPGIYAPFTVRKDAITIKAVDRDGASVLVDGQLGNDPTADGVTLLGDRIHLEGLTVRDSVSGFRVEGSSNTLLRSFAYENVVGFRISGNSNFLESNTAFANRRDGFFVTAESTGTTLLHNLSDTNLRHGYWLGGSGDVASYNSAKGNQVGFLLAGRTASLQNNEATLSQQAGFVLESGGHTLASNTSKSNRQHGFWALQSSSRNRYDSNVAQSNAAAGFRIDSSLDMLVGNLSTANAAEGFLVAGPNHVMSTNTSVDNRSHGFLLLQSGSRLYRNQSRKNAGWGLRLQAAGNTLVENLAEENQLGDIG